MTETDWGLIVAAWLTGLASGTGHCLGMCGGIVGALGLSRSGRLGSAVNLLAAHLGRMAAYATMGALVAGLGAAAMHGLVGAAGLRLLRMVAAALIGLIGLQLLLGRPLLVYLERGGAVLWRRLAPLLRGWLPPRNPMQALAVGMLWGWLPCGLVYAQLAVAAASGTPLVGMLVMIAFGLGTALGLSAIGLLLQSLGLGRLPRQASGVLLIVFAIWTLLPLLRSGGHGFTH
jgi:sulfite exporter TauE/SafE